MFLAQDHLHPMQGGPIVLAGKGTPFLSTPGIPEFLAFFALLSIHSSGVRVRFLVNGLLGFRFNLLEIEIGSGTRNILQSLLSEFCVEPEIHKILLIECNKGVEFEFTLFTVTSMIIKGDNENSIMKNFYKKYAKYL